MAQQRISESLADGLAQSPDAQFQLLVRVDRADDETAQKLSALGMEIHRRLQLLPIFAVTCRGRTALKLLEETWVERIEEDRAVHTW